MIAVPGMHGADHLGRNADWTENHEFSGQKIAGHIPGRRERAQHEARDTQQQQLAAHGTLWLVGLAAHFT